MAKRKSRPKGGRRADLGGLFFRSAWEANYARYLNLLLKTGKISSWEYEAKTFGFPIKRGTRSYTPDFRVIFPCGRVEWHEVKGWMDAPSKTRLKRFAKYYPDETLVLIDKKWFAQASRNGLKHFVPGWESPEAKR